MQSDGWQSIFSELAELGSAALAAHSCMGPRKHGLTHWDPRSTGLANELIGLSTHLGTGVDGASGRGWKLADFLLKHVWFSSLLFKSYGEKPIEISRMPRGGHITYRFKIWSDLFLRNKSYRLLNYWFHQTICKQPICVFSPVHRPWRPRGGLADSSLSNRRA